MRFLPQPDFAIVVGRAVRLDILERIEAMLWQAARNGRESDETRADLASLLGCGPEEVMAIARALGWRRAHTEGHGEAAPASWQRMHGKHHDKRHGKKQQVDQSKPQPNSPFAGLAALIRPD